MKWPTAKTADGPVPRHVAFIMDGNRRWARAAGHADVSLGHQFGAVRGEQVLEWCRAAKIPHVTVYVASLDNIRKRPAAEIDRLMCLIESFVEARLAQRDCRLHVAGRIENLPCHTAGVLRRACDASAAFPTDFHLTAAIAYDGRTEIVDAVLSWLRKQAKHGATLGQAADRLSVEDISANLYSPGQPNPELVIRTGGDVRLSCFMPWQTAYSHLHFCRTYWPDLSEAEFARAVRAYATRMARSPTRLRNGGTNRENVALSTVGRTLSWVTNRIREFRACRDLTGLRRPKHVAILLATTFPSTKAHHGGDGLHNRVSELISWCIEFGIEAVTLGVFAAAQLLKPAAELKAHLDELVRVVEELSESPLKPRLRLYGMLHLLPEPAQSRIVAAANQTAGHTGQNINFAICYDGPSEVVHAVRKVLAEHAMQGHSIEDEFGHFDIADVTRILCPPSEPEVDLIIGIPRHQTLNGFLLWQSVRSEFWFCKGGITRFRKADFLRALRDYGLRNRRFGA